MKIRSTSVAVLAAVPLVLAGCSQGAPEASKPAPQSPPPQAAPQQPAAQPHGEASPDGVAWVGKLCGLVGGFTQAQQKLPGVDRSNTATFKQSSIAQLDAAEKSAEDTIKGLQQLGPSPIGGADKVNHAFVDGFGQVKDVLATAKGKAEQVDPGNEQAFQSGMSQVRDELQKGQNIKLGGELAEFDRNKELNAAAVQAPECKPLIQQPPQQPGAPR
ncbi:hypothetical protein [Saccharopolyspora rosea]|uniref:Small secreted protein n=1 Tax=Saccharopolyspora rosea TaxID=524884 RepID=A0ABW3FT37_9PSEU|nr:hypothetical protein [Saccharopolyspora rosea]